MVMSNRILVVDDESIILQLATMVLTSRGFEVLTAQSGQECLDVVKAEKPDLVLLDYMMPVMDGMTTLRHLRHLHPDTYVIMLTGKGSEQIAVEVMKAGAADYILKPFKNQDLVERIENVLRIRRIEMHNRELREERERLLSEIEVWNMELERRVAEKTRELELAHAEILQAEKLAALGHVSAGMAHEIRNPLNAIGLFAQILRPVMAHDTEKSGYIDKLLQEVDRIDAILSKLLDASKAPKVTLEPVCLIGTIDRILETFSEQLKASHVKVEKNYAQVPPLMMADSGEIEQIFTNLFANSLYEMQHGGVLGVTVHYDGQKATIEVSDTGGGIPRENLSQIFDPFFTTKTKGTGFGLSVVLRIVKNYHGHINVRSTAGEGTVFNLEFPLALQSN
jgi:signal transduction histidine kinase